MTDLNCVEIIGNLTKDLMSDERNFGISNSGIARANISIAVNRSRKNGDQWVDDVSYFDVTIWGKTAENLKPYLVKGQKVAVKGFLKQDRWESNGQKYNRVSIVAEGVWLVGNRLAGNGGNNPGANNQNYQPNQNYQRQQTNNDNNNYQQSDNYAPTTDLSDVPF